MVGLPYSLELPDIQNAEEGPIGQTAGFINHKICAGSRGRLLC